MLLLIVLVFTLSSAEKKDTHLTSELFNELFKDYHKESFPIDQDESSPNHTLDVSFGLGIINIDFDEQKSTLHVTAWNFLNWRDPRLAYDHKKYARNVLRLYNDLVWTPDVTLYNSVEFATPPFPPHYHLMVYPKGDVWFVPPSLYKVHCDEDLTFWPWDTQNCSLKFGSWVHSDFSMNIRLYDRQDQFTLSNYRGQARWLIKEHRTEKNTYKYDCCNETYSSISTSLLIQRQASGKAYLLMAPTVVVCLLTLVIFCLPPTTPEKLNLASLNVIVIVLHLLYFAMALPLRTEHPRMATLLVCCLFMVVISMFFTFGTSVLLEREWIPPNILTNLTSGTCGRILCVSTTKKRSNNTGQSEDQEKPMFEEQVLTPYQECYQVMSLFDRIMLILFALVIIGLLGSLC